MMKIKHIIDGNMKYSKNFFIDKTKTYKNNNNIVVLNFKEMVEWIYGIY